MQALVQGSLPWCKLFRTGADDPAQEECDARSSARQATQDPQDPQDHEAQSRQLESMSNNQVSVTPCNGLKSTGTTVGDVPDLMHPLFECFEAARQALTKEVHIDPAPGFTCEQIADTTTWLLRAVDSMRRHNAGFCQSGLERLDDEALQRNRDLARESSTMLSVLSADGTLHFGGVQKLELELQSGLQRPEVRSVLAHIEGFLKHLSNAKWLGSHIEQSLQRVKETTLALLTALQRQSDIRDDPPPRPPVKEADSPRTKSNGCATPGKARSSDSSKSWLYCSHCGGATQRNLGFCQDCGYCGHGYHHGSYPLGCPDGCNVPSGAASYCTRCRRRSLKHLGFCESCGQCGHGHSRKHYPNGCPAGCYMPSAEEVAHLAVTNEISRTAADIFKEIPHFSQGSAGQLTRLAKMAEVLRETCEKDAAERQQEEASLQRKMKNLKAFAFAVKSIAEVLRTFLLIRIGAITDSNHALELKQFVAHEEVIAMHKQLEEFRDMASEEKVMRRMRVSEHAQQNNESLRL